MSTVEAGWALFGKHPGSFDDFMVIAASRRPFELAQFQQIISGFSPGNSPASREASADSLPWVSFSSATLQGTTFVGIAVREWAVQSGGTDRPITDGTNRPIAFTRYFCIRLDDLRDSSATFTDLYHAVRDIQLPWQVSDPLAGDPLQLQLPPADPAAVARIVENIGVDRVATTAAALFESPVAVLGGTTDLAGRLRFLDAVAALLPLGARAWLSASSWADSGTNHRFSLAFTQRRRAADRLITERGKYESPQHEPTERYRQELVRLSRDKGTAMVVGHLAGLVSHREQHTDKAVEALADLDVAGATLRKAQDGSLQPVDVRRLNAINRLGDLSRAEREFLLSSYLLVAQADDLEADLQLLTGQWSPGLTTQLVQVARERLWTHHWPTGDLARLAAVADRVGAREDFIAVLALPADGAQSSAALAAAAGLATCLDTEWHHDTSLLAAVTRIPELAVAVVRQYLSADPKEAANWLCRLEQFAPARSATLSWPVVARPFEAALLDRADPVYHGEIAALAQLDASVVPDLVSVCRAGPVDRLERLLHGVLPWLHQQVATIDTGRQQRWATELAQLVSADDGQQAEIDVLLYRLRRTPVRTPVEAVHDGQRQRTEYINSFVKHTWEANLPDHEHRKLAETLARRLGHGWSLPEDRFEAVLDLLWEVSHSPSNLRQSRVTRFLLETILEGIGKRTDLLNSQAFARWMDDLTKYPDLEQWVALSRRRGIPADASIAEAANFIVKLLKSGCTNEQAITFLHNSEYRPPRGQLGDLLQAITASLERIDYPEPYLFSYLLGRQIIAYNANQSQAATAGKRFPSRLAPQILLDSMLFYEATWKGDEATRESLRQQIAMLKEAHKILGTTIARLEKRESSGKSFLNPLRYLGGRQPEVAETEQREDNER